MTPHELVGIAAAIFALAAVVPYIWDIIGKITKPNTVTYFVWTLLQSIAIYAQIQAGASWSVFLMVGTTIGTAVVFILSLTHYGYKHFTWVDAASLVLAGFAILILIFTKHPVLAILLPILGDAIGAMPTIVKTRDHPETEERLAWFLMIVACALGILATEKFDLANLAYPVFLLFEAIVIFCLAFFGKRKLVCKWGRGCV
jgi:hypothetical protein